MKTNLYAAEKGRSLTVTYVPNIDLLRNMGLRAGSQAMVQSKYIWGGPVLLRVEGAYSIALGKDIAVQIGVLVQ
jgi:Fe2+ transport system protein FeoA